MLALPKFTACHRAARLLASAQEAASTHASAVTLRDLGEDLVTGQAVWQDTGRELSQAWAQGKAGRELGLRAGMETQQ